MNRGHSEALSHQLFWSPLKEQSRRLVVIAVALIFLSLAHGALLILVGPLLGTILNGDPNKPLEVTSMLPGPLQSWFGGMALDLSLANLSYLIPGAMILFGLMKSVSTYFYHLNQNILALSMAQHYRDRLFHAILSQPYLRLSEKSPAHWMSILLNDVHMLQARFSELATNLVRDVVIVLTALVTMALIHWPSTVLLVVSAPVIALGMGRVGRTIAGYAFAWQTKLAHLVSVLLSIRERHDFIQVAKGKERELEHFAKVNQSYYDHVAKSLMVRSAFAPWVEFFGFALFVAALYGISTGVWFGEMSGTELLQLFAALGLLVKPLKNIGEQFSKFQETRGALRSSLEIFQDGASRDPSDQPSSDPWTKPLQIHHIEVGHQEGSPAIKGHGLVLEPGKAIALIGPSGAGKSTLLKSLAGLIPPQVWQSNAPWHKVHQQFRFVGQKPFLFEDTLWANLTYKADGGTTEDSVWAALDEVGMAQEITHKPQGLNHKVGVIRPNYSGGQVQRLALARAMLAPKQGWLMDEVTSAIDSKNERELTLKFIQWAKEQNKFLVMATHRLRWLDSFDEVWFVEDGSVKLQGKHTDLLEHDRYHAFVSSNG